MLDPMFVVIILVNIELFCGVYLFLPFQLKEQNVRSCFKNCMFPVSLQRNVLFALKAMLPAATNVC